MKRSTRMGLARQTVEITERGTYTPAGGRPVDIASAVRDCLDATRRFTPMELKRLRNDMLANPRGGFLNGSQAQEESLARSSALHASLLRAWDFYEQHRASPPRLYSDAMILSPGCPVFRDDEGALLAEPREVAFITSAAPNAGAAANNRPDELPAIPDVFRRRSEYVLVIAAAYGYTRLVLGAWGCGVFRNDPTVVAAAFAGHLRGVWAGRFERVLFSVLDTSASLDTFEVFRSASAPDAGTGAAADGAIEESSA